MNPCYMERLIPSQISREIPPGCGLPIILPLAVITFIPMLPIRALYNYTAKTVNDFNMLLLEVCQRFGCIFFDCFSDFLSHDYRDYNPTLFRDKWHPNERGLALLCRAIKCIIFGSLVSSQVRCFWHMPFYSYLYSPLVDIR